MPRPIIKLPRGNRRGNNCGVTALAAVAEVHFNDVWEYIKQSKPGNWEGSVNEDDIRGVLKAFGIRYRSRHYNRDINVRWFAGHYARPSRVYLIDVYDHIALLQDGYILDQRGIYFDMDEKGHWKVHQVYAILP